MKTIFITQGKLIFQVLLIVLYQWSIGLCQFNLYDTDQRFQSNALQYDCLNYHVRRETLAYQELSDVVDEIIPYCFRPTSDVDASFEDFDASSHTKFSFEELFRNNISPQQLLSWSIPIEVIEQYEMYLSAPNTALNEDLYNCTPPRFGLRCQYSFEFGEELSFNDIVALDFHGREAYHESSEMEVQVPCYVLLKCHRHRQAWCLDWREVCDGVIDCFDEESDEESCFDLEINECGDDEFRCHNGMCISQELWEDGDGETDCLDRSDKGGDISYTESCFRNPTFLCEEHSCGTDLTPFSCGDGQCVFKLGFCQNGRHMLLLNSIKSQGNLTKECWIAMVCLTKLDTEVNGIHCEILFEDKNTVKKALEQCEPFFSFPIVPVHSNYVYFFYKDLNLKLNEDEISLPYLPDYICYNRQLCDSITSDFVHEDQPCFNSSNLLSYLPEISLSWGGIMVLVDPFFRSCLASRNILNDKTTYTNHPSLYQCRHSTKLISKHRIMDKIQDCPENDDEEYANSCQLNDPYRVTCINMSNCWSPIVKKYVCKSNRFQEINEIQFKSFCNGIAEYFYDNYGRKLSDELGCEIWSCNNMYTRCDGFWNCKDGQDEYNCIETQCPSATYPCISRVNYTLICLSSVLVNDELVHCIGALDEQLLCRFRHLMGIHGSIFRCSTKQRCLAISQVCNGKVDCPDGDDEDENLCGPRSIVQDVDTAQNRRDGIERLFWELQRLGNLSIFYFSVHTSSNYPLLTDDLIRAFDYRSASAEHSLITSSSLSQVHQNQWPWLCHRGLTLLHWITNNNNNSVCICPPSYYGALCQYQNQRVSLTLRLTSNHRHATYAVISMLMDDTDKQLLIHAYDQFVYIAKQSCSLKLNRYLLFQSRPKDLSRNYSVRIDVFEKNTMTYVGSWHFPIAFLFLPVNRLSVALSLANHHIQHSSLCPNKCVHGECIKYVNKAIYFCRCSAQWSGIHCDIPQTCQTCSSESICIGSTNNRSICVCPIDRYGRQCSSISKCPHNICQNNGQCIPADLTVPGSVHTCVCTDRYFGQHCENRKAQLDVSLDNLDIPPYLVAHFFTLSNQSDPIETIVLRKLTLFQHVVTFHIAVPFHLAFVKADNKHYLAVLQQSPRMHIATSIHPQQQCFPAQQLFNSTVMQMISYQRIVHFHWLCHTDHTMKCFMDETYLCLCTNDHHANCMKFNHSRSFNCPSNTHCKNGEQCLQDHPHCPSTKICLCRSCFFGSECQFYAKALGSTLDEILGYEFRRNQPLIKQSFRVLVAASVTIVIFFIGLINSILAMITFSRSKAREVGCGKYLLASSVTSLLTMVTLVFKFCFLFYSHQDQKHLKRIEIGNCFGIEILLKVFLYLDNWLNACIAMERTISVWRGIRFDKKRSRKIANKITVFLLIMICALLIPQYVHLDVFHDETEERSWCVVRYVKWLSIYSSVLIVIHYFMPLAINIFSIVCIIILTTRQLSQIQSNRSVWMHLRSRIRKNKHIIMSALIIVVLTLPHLIGSMVIECQKSSELFWFYLISYYLSFLPAAFIFVIFALPSSLYRKEFSQFVLDVRHRVKSSRLIYSRAHVSHLRKS